MKYYFAADIGGTKTAIGLYDEAYNEIYHGKILTEPSEGCEKLLDKLYGMAGRLFEEYPVAGAGIACPGPLDVSRGVVNNTTTLGWYNVPVRRLFSEKFGVEFALLNDCNAGAYGEYVVRNCKNMAYMSISTGIGGGIIVDGKLYNGQGNAAEFGHLYAGGRHLKCGCGREDCLELYASGTAVESEYFRRTGKRLSGVDNCGTCEHRRRGGCEHLRKRCGVYRGGGRGHSKNPRSRTRRYRRGRRRGGAVQKCRRLSEDRAIRRESRLFRSGRKAGAARYHPLYSRFYGNQGDRSE